MHGLGLRVVGWIAAAAFAVLAGSACAGPISVTTYHYDNYRTGWDQFETGLTPKRVQSANFGMIAATPLDDQVDAQPLVLGDQKIQGHGRHEVVYVATEGDTIYAIDATNGNILLQRNFGTPVPFTALPGWCNNNGPDIGINSTPVIDPATHTIYVIADTYEGGNAIYRIHALDPATLADTVPPVVVSASGVLSDGSIYRFNAYASRLRSALLVASGNVYAGFASYCDNSADQSRGWILGWQTGTLTPLASNELTNKLAHSTDDFFLSSIWMSGYGLAASVGGDIYFVTGNSDYSGDSYSPVKNIGESVVQLSSDLTTVKSLFTPMDPTYNWQNLDVWDADFGSGGAMLLPPQAGAADNILVAAGKVGVLYSLNADDLNNGRKKGGQPFGRYDVGNCWCGPSYYKGSDGTGRVVSSGGSTVDVWKVTVKNGKPRLTLRNQPGSIGGGQDPGFFTAVSSNGAVKNTAVIWAVSRPADNDPAEVRLYAFDADKGGTLFTDVAGAWPNTGGNANIVPVVANGKVYVASDQTLSIFGMAAAGAVRPALPRPTRVDMRIPLAPGQHEIYGIVRAASDRTITIARRDGTTMTVDASNAVRKFDFAHPWAGHGMIARGTVGADGVMKADIVLHAKADPKMWQPDR